MGNKQTVPLNIQDQWISHHENSQPQLVHNSQGIQGELYFILADPMQSIQDQMRIYDYRKDKNNALISVYDVKCVEPKDKLLCGNQLYLKIVTEKIIRYNTLPRLTLPQTIYALCQSLRGFRQCFFREGYFQVNQNMIGINSQKKIKVWLNQKFGQNHSALRIPLLQTTAKESEINKRQIQFVKNLIEIIFRKCDKTFQQILSNENSPQKYTFEQTFTFIQKYCEKENIQIPDGIYLKEKNDLYLEQQEFQRPVNNNTYLDTLNSIRNRQIYQTGEIKKSTNLNFINEYRDKEVLIEPFKPQYLKSYGSLNYQRENANLFLRQPKEQEGAHRIMTIPAQLSKSILFHYPIQNMGYKHY